MNTGTLNPSRCPNCDAELKYLKVRMTGTVNVLSGTTSWMYDTIEPKPYRDPVNWSDPAAMVNHAFCYGCNSEVEVEFIEDPMFKVREEEDDDTND